MAPLYLEHFGLTEAPFSLAPDPRYLFLGQGHREALAMLLYGLDCEGGLVVLTGETGTGKTTLVRCLMDQMPNDCEVALMVNPPAERLELLRGIVEEFGGRIVDSRAGAKDVVDHLLSGLKEAEARSRRSVLIIDEAQNLRSDALEEIRLLTNLSSRRRPFLRVLLIGQPELQAVLSRPKSERLAQRVVARYHLGALNPMEASACIVHRLAVAGCRHEVFTPPALERLYRLGGGIPRRMCVLADRALLGGFAQSLKQINEATIVQAAREVEGVSPAKRFLSPRAALAGLVRVAG